MSASSKRIRYNIITCLIPVRRSSLSVSLHDTVIYSAGKRDSIMSAFVKINLHGMCQEEAVRVIDRAIRNVDSSTYQIHLIHGYNRGSSLRNMIYDECRYEPKVKRIIPGENPGITILMMRELYR